MILLILKTRSKSNSWHATKVLSLCISGMIITSLPQMGCPLNQEMRTQWPNFGMPYSAHLRCPQVWYLIPRTSGFNLCHPCLPTEGRTDGCQMLGYVISFADWQKKKKLKQSWPLVAKNELQCAKTWLKFGPWSKECVCEFDQLKTQWFTVHRRNKWIWT